MPKDDESQTLEPTADLSNPRETQNILAIVVVVGLVVLAGIAILVILARGGTVADVATILEKVSYLAGIIVVFYFADKNAKMTAQAVASSGQ
jgi:Kef-type K+ transport system membrane component KefB